MISRELKILFSIKEITQSKSKSTPKTHPLSPQKCKYLNSKLQFYLESAGDRFSRLLPPCHVVATTCSAARETPSSKSLQAEGELGCRGSQGHGCIHPLNVCKAVQQQLRVLCHLNMQSNLAATEVTICLPMTAKNPNVLLYKVV